MTGKKLPIAPTADPPRRHLPLAGPPRPVDRRWRPTYVVWEITLRCDLACHHCGSRAGRARPDELTTAECLDLVQQMAELGVSEVTLIGGEAYLRDDWTEIARAVVQAGMTCTVTTGGRGLTAERVAAAVAAGVRTFSVSIDGLEATHDRLRGVQGSFRAAREAIRHVREAGMSPQANTQIGRANLHELPDVFSLLLEEKIKVWQVQVTVAMGRAADHPELLLEPWQMADLIPLLARFQTEGNPRGLRIWPANNIGYFGPHERVLRPFGHFGSCGAGKLLLGIEANGDIKGCPSLPTEDYVGGNIRDHSLREIWEQTDALRFTRDRTVDDLWGFCRSCYYAEVCMGGCSWTAHVLSGKPGNNPYCYHRASELRRRGLRERLRLAVPAGGKPFDYARYEIFTEPLSADSDAVEASGPGKESGYAGDR